MNFNRSHLAVFAEVFLCDVKDGLRTCVDMKPSDPETQRTVDKMVEEPSVSFSHLSSYFASEDSLNDNQSTAYGFPVPQEEDLYQTGYLSKVFLKC